MSRYLSYVSIFFLFIIVSCQKEKSFEQGKLSRGSLQGAFGDCLAKKVGGTYTATKSLADTNYIDVTVDVAQTGNYTVYTDTVNGYFFRATGTFTTVGSATVRMKGFGTPGSAGIDDFTVVYDTTVCDISITVLPNSGSSGGTAVYTLQQGTGGNCMNATPAGIYTQGVALTSANKIAIDVNVTTVGTWNVTTSSVGGFSFSGSGTFATTGVQTITLTASGTPTASGAQNFPVTVGTSSCSFTITVGGGATQTGLHFPLTANSFWTFNDPAGNPGDTIMRKNTSTGTFNGNTYQVFEESDATGPYTEYYYRKSGNNYYEYALVDDYSFITFDGNGVEGDILFLKEGLNTNDTWLSSEFSGSVSGTATKLRYSYKCTDANATVTVNTHTFTGVYKITWKSQVSIAGAPYADEGLTWETYYAKDVGLIYEKVTYGTDNAEWKLRYYKVF